jgi:hypothetical protein
MVGKGGWRMMNKRILGAVVILALAALACGVDLLPGGGGSSKPAPTPDNVIFQDDFGDSGSGWEVGDYDEGSVGYKDGAYFVTATITDYMMWGVANRSFDNLVIEVDATQVSAGPISDNAYGVVCREDGNAGGYYLRISGDGYYSIARAAGVGEAEEFVPLVDWAESSAIKQGNATNHIRAVCSDSTLELHVNGEHVATAEDSTFTSGDIAFSATSYESEATEIHFDNLVVRTP